MRLRRIEIANFRKLAGPVVLDGLGDGLIVVSGDNEEGKSTVLAALKAAIFEHHAVGGAVREAMNPHRGGTPEVGVDFECGGQRYRLRKAFRRGGITLETPERKLTDDAAERTLQELLRFERRQARSPRPENAGLQALFWVDQATTFQGFDGLAGGRDRLAAAIAAEVGAVAGGERSRRLLAVARERLAVFYTPGRQQETGALKAASEALRLLEVEQQGLAARRRDYDGRVDRLARLRAERRRLIEQDAVGRARHRLDDTRRRLAELEELERLGALAAESLKSASAELARVEAQQRSRLDLLDEALRLAGARSEIAARAGAGERELAVLRHGAEATREREAMMSAEVAAAQQAAADSGDRLAMARLAGEIERLRTAVGRGTAALDGARRAKAVLAASRATAESLARLRELQQQRQDAATRIEAAATRLEFLPDGPRGVALAGAALDPASPLRLTERVELVLEGFGRLVVVPGGEDLPHRQQALRSTEQALADALGAMGVTSLSEAEAAFGRWREVDAELRRYQAETKGLLQAVPASSVEQVAQLLAAKEAELATVADRARSSMPSIDAADLEREASRRALELAQAQDRLAEARSAADAAARRVADGMAEVARLGAERQGAASRVEEIGQRIAVERERIGDDALVGQLREASLRRRAAEASDDQVGRDLRGADPDGLRDRLAIVERELAALDGERRRLDGEIRDLEVALREAGADGWAERLTEVEGKLVVAHDQRRRLELEGRAWRLLTEQLQAADQAACDALVAPIGQRLRPLLQRVFPGAEPVLDPERLALTHLCRDGRHEGFDSLSVGAREQLAILVRLAFARLLAEREGEASCLILDDALVYADEARFEIMKTILQRAAQELQILVLTCRPRDYFGLDARYLRLEDCRAP